MKLFAQLVSFLFHPVVFLLLIPFLIVYKQTYSGFYALKWEVFTAVFIFCGLSFFLLGKWRGFFSDYDLTKREERKRFFGIVGLLCIVYLAIALAFKGIFFPLSLVAIGIMLTIICIAILNKYMKVSIHTCAATAFVLTVGALFGKIPFLATVGIVPLIASSRMYLERHTIYELLVGTMLGAGITVLIFLVGGYILAGINIFQ